MSAFLHSTSLFCVQILNFSSRKSSAFGTTVLLILDNSKIQTLLVTRSEKGQAIHIPIWAPSPHCKRGTGEVDDDNGLSMDKGKGNPTACSTHRPNPATTNEWPSCSEHERPVRRLAQVRFRLLKVRSGSSNDKPAQQLTRMVQSHGRLVREERLAYGNRKAKREVVAFFFLPFNSRMDRPPAHNASCVPERAAVARLPTTTAARDRGRRAPIRRAPSSTAGRSGGWSAGRIHTWPETATRPARERGWDHAAQGQALN